MIYSLYFRRNSDCLSKSKIRRYLSHMKMLTQSEDFLQLKSKDNALFECEFCGIHFNRSVGSVKYQIINNPSRRSFCSPKCSTNFTNKIKRRTLKCESCGKESLVKLSDPRRFCSNSCSNSVRKQQVVSTCKNCGSLFTRQKSKSHKFCSRKCNCKYHNNHKDWASNRSKLELWIESELLSEYPDLEIHFNRRDTINGELDIYIPSLKLAFELNGIFHYEPIFGENTLSRTMNNDNRKFQACLERGIELCVIDTHHAKYHKKERDKKFFNIIEMIIKKKLSVS